MKYQLKELCSITKGATGIMKADGGKYPLVALSDERRNHSEFQFDANAVIVPLISSTGHGHASMKRVHYQEGKFALGNILCAVIPNNEKQLNAKYLHLYLQQFKESLLVPLMKGAANVSLPMNKLSDVEIEVPSLDRQLEIIALEEEAAKYKNELEERLKAQDGDVAKLRQALIKEAMEGKLVVQNVSDGNTMDYLKKVKVEKEFPEIRENEIPFEIPNSWKWCRLGNFILDSQSGLEKNKQEQSSSFEFSYFKMNDIYEFGIANLKNLTRVRATNEEILKYKLNKGDFLFNTRNSRELVGKTCAIIEEISDPVLFNNNIVRLRLTINPYFINYYFCSSYNKKCMSKLVTATTNVAAIYLGQMVNILVPLPPLPEQERIVKKLDQLMQMCDELQRSIQLSKIENEKLLQGALKDALKKDEF